MKLTDTQIIKGLSEEDPKVFRQILEDEKPRIVRYIQQNSGTQADADEVFSEALLLAYNNVIAGKYSGQGKFSAYFFSIASNIWLMRLRKQKQAVKTTELDTHIFHLIDEGWTDVYAKTQDEQLNAIYRAIQRLDEKCAELIRKFHLEAVMLKEIAIAWNMTYEAVRKRVFDCRNRLKLLSLEEFDKRDNQ